MPAVRLSAVIITRNEAANIARCLDGLAGLVDEIVIVDSGSTDATEALARAHPTHPRWVHQPWLGFAGQKQFAAEAATHDYILNVDADEVPDAPLRAAIAAAKADWRYDAYRCRRLMNYCGRWIRHGGWYPDVKTRLYDRRHARWQGAGVHETLTLAPGARVGRLSGHLLHYGVATVAQHLATVDKYTELQAQALLARRPRPNAGTWAKLIFSPLIKWLRDYVLRLGFLDGFAGLVIATVSAHATFLKYAKYLAKAGALPQEAALARAEAPQPAHPGTAAEGPAGRD